MSVDDPATELARITLPVSGRVVVVRAPSGAEDLLLRESATSPAGDVSLALALAGRLARPVDGGSLDWSGLPPTDLDAFVLRLRQATIGDRLRADLACPSESCGDRIDINFSIEDYLDHLAPKGGRGRFVADEDGWYPAFRSRSDRDPASFRLPTVADLVEAAGRPDSAERLARRCLRGVGDRPRLRRRIETLMEAMAPSLSGDVRGSCPECGASVVVNFDARWFCLHELRGRAAFIYQDVDILARRYHWSEWEILALPQDRRTAYAELALQGGGI